MFTVVFVFTNDMNWIINISESLWPLIHLCPETTIHTALFVAALVSQRVTQYIKVHEGSCRYSDWCIYTL